jgi:hypothetical protein
MKIPAADILEGVWIEDGAGGWSRGYRPFLYGLTYACGVRWILILDGYPRVYKEGSEGSREAAKSACDEAARKCLDEGVSA